MWREKGSNVEFPAAGNARFFVLPGNTGGITQAVLWSFSMPPT